MNKVIQGRSDIIIGFVDECSPQTTSNTQRLWSFKKPEMRKNTSRMRANTFGFYALNGVSVVDFKEDSKTGSFCEFLIKIRNRNKGNDIAIVIDNFTTHHAKKVQETAEELNIFLIYLPPYSPDLNPIEFIWKSIKRCISPLFIENRAAFQIIIQDAFYKFAGSLDYAKKWIIEFLGNKFKLICR